MALIVSERGPRGARLVAVDEHGDRQVELIAPAAALARDTHPAVSPDGRWLVFASSRGRGLDSTRLWIAPVAAQAEPRLLTDSPGIDAHPAWTPDGAAIVFASTRAGTFDLWRLAMRAGAPGALTRLTSGAGHEITPALARDGAIVYTEVTAHGADRERHLELRAPDGAITRLTDGPADSAPALSPDGTQLVFARPRKHGEQLNDELWMMPRAGGAARPLVELPLTDEGGPVFSRDGRFVFATSVVRGEAGVLWSSVIHIDLRATPLVARILEDRVGATVRLTPAVTATRLDARALDAAPMYLPELAQIMQRVIEAAQTSAPPR